MAKAQLFSLADEKSDLPGNDAVAGSPLQPNTDGQS
jgi:hypothetical protein